MVVAEPEALALLLLLLLPLALLLLPLPATFLYRSQQQLHCMVWNQKPVFAAAAGNPQFQHQGPRRCAALHHTPVVVV
jgi:hypothetical protein